MRIYSHNGHVMMANRVAILASMQVQRRSRVGVRDMHIDVTSGVKGACLAPLIGVVLYRRRSKGALTLDSMVRGCKVRLYQNS